MALSLPITYFGNVEYFWHLMQHSKASIDIEEPYQKQTFRNRCVVLGANGPLNLTVPVERPNGSQTKTKDVLLSHAENWKNVHWKTLESCYNRTPYFEFYADDIKAILFTDFQKLSSLNLALTEHLINKIGLVSEINMDKMVQDHSQQFSPKKETSFKTHHYLQTFSERFGFINNLSILDLIFNEGPNTICILNESHYEN